MAVRKDKVSELIQLAKTHDALVSIKGWRADSESDAAWEAYDRSRRSATAEEISVFESIYM